MVSMSFLSRFWLVNILFHELICCWVNPRYLREIMPTIPFYDHVLLQCHSKIRDIYPISNIVIPSGNLT